MYNAHTYILDIHFWAKNRSVLWLRIHWIQIQIQIQHFKWIRIRIQGFDDQKVKKKIQQKIFQSFFDQNLQFTYPQAFIKNVQATGEALSPRKRTSSTSKDEIH